MMSYNSRLLFEMVSSCLHESPRQTLREVSVKLRVSDRTIEKSVRSSIGRSFKCFREEVFLAEIRRFLTTQPNMPIKVVSLTLGFKSCSSFARAVRRASGLSPQELRSCPSYHESAQGGATPSNAMNLRTFRRRNTASERSY
jgi:transcriptional regulator GlxA family with amidase domain